MKLKRWKPYAFLAAVFLGAGCVSTTMQQVRPEPGFDSRQIHRVLVIGVIQDLALRKQLEEEFVRQWKRRGPDAVSGFDVLPSTATLDKAGVAPVARAQGFDTVLVSRLLKRERYGPGKRTDPVAQAQVQKMSSLEQTLQAPPVAATAYDLTAVETTVFDVKAEKPIWSGISDTAVVGSVSKLIPSFVKTILNSLYQTPPSASK